MGLELTADQTERLWERTEGWAAGLYLAGLSLRGQPDPGPFIASFEAGHRHVVDYLGAEVLARQPEPLRELHGPHLGPGAAVGAAVRRGAGDRGVGRAAGRAGAGQPVPDRPGRPPPLVPLPPPVRPAAAPGAGRARAGAGPAAAPAGRRLPPGRRRRGGGRPPRQRRRRLPAGHRPGHRPLAVVRAAGTGRDRRALAGRAARRGRRRRAVGGGGQGVDRRATAASPGRSWTAGWPSASTRRPRGAGPRLGRLGAVRGRHRPRPLHLRRRRHGPGGRPPGHRARRPGTVRGGLDGHGGARAEPSTWPGGRPRPGRCWRRSPSTTSPPSGSRSPWSTSSGWPPCSPASRETTPPRRRWPGGRWRSPRPAGSASTR